MLHPSKAVARLARVRASLSRRLRRAVSHAPRRLRLMGIFIGSMIVSHVLGLIVFSALAGMIAEAIR